MSVCVCVSTPAQRKAYQSPLYTSKRNNNQSWKVTQKIPVEIPVIIPVTPSVDVYAFETTPLAAIAFGLPPRAAVVYVSSPLAAVIILDHIRPTCPGVKLGPKDHSHPAWCRTGPQG